MTNSTDHPKSYHIFVFPFKWDIKPRENSLEKTGFSRRTSLNDFQKSLSTADWKENLFEISDAPGFNEYIYFYDFARDALFPDENKNKILRQYEYIFDPGAKPVYKIKPLDSANPYELNIEKIRLTTYFTGVGILSFHLVNDKYREFQDLLRVNEFGRRLYPQFLGSSGKRTKDTKDAFLADSLEVSIDSARKFQEDFSHFDTLANVNRNPHRLSHTIMGLLGNSFFTEEPGKEQEGVLISPVLDDRMFVLCWLADKVRSERLARYDKDRGTYGYVENGDWYKLIFIDKNSPSCNSIPMKKKLLSEHTYDRWIGTQWGSLFGVTRYSFILLTDNRETYVKDHIKTMYFQMIKLALVQRASILRFSAEATRIADLKENENTTQEVSKLQEKYLQFINKIYFREVTAFEQGIDLYEKIHQAMKIERDVKELDREIEELRHYASLREEDRHNRQLRLLTILGSLFLVPGFILGFFGMNLFSEKLEVNAPGRLCVIFASILFASLLSWLVIKLKTQWPEKLTWHRRLILIGIIIFILLLLVCLLTGCLFKKIGV
jgi:hypothetical protein